MSLPSTLLVGGTSRADAFSNSVRRLVRNFLCTGSDGSQDTRARVVWPTMILPCEGGLRIFDAKMQSQALLRSF